MNFSDYWKQIQADLDWRQAELASLKVLVITCTPQTKKALLRSLLAMLYAHYQGFCINALTVYAKFICKMGDAVNKHELPIILTSLTDILKNMKNMTDADLYAYIKNEFNSAQISPINLDYDNEFTTSNLYPNVLEDLCQKVGLDLPEIDSRRTIVRSLVGRRNDIAHGKEGDVNDLAEYTHYEDAAINVMYSLALAIEDGMRNKSFLKN